MYEQFANCENVTFKNILSIEETYCDTNRGIYNNRNDYTVIAAVNTNDLEISTTTLEFTFKQNGEVVREHSVDIYYVYYTIRGYASANEATADIQELDYIDGAYYLFGVTIIGVPAGTYDVEMRVVAWAGFLGYEVYSDVYYDTITFE